VSSTLIDASRLVRTFLRANTSTPLPYSHAVVLSSSGGSGDVQSPSPLVKSKRRQLESLTVRSEERVIVRAYLFMSRSVCLSTIDCPSCYEDRS
jgi:hypothetical protein